MDTNDDANDDGRSMTVLVRIALVEKEDEGGNIGIDIGIGSSMMPSTTSIG
eukprot:CAMPEP_0203731270 /NCGR_PEP_ID=MMETSP0092-20131115/22008_1 /ASSEMBLY_ACC=CAM_ASM_001090 /TAXON_ID=426623 /ORGANISM="Chaetoceros affinis, Strain CCMP159" /LENGTH=50 /DNA_ID=CAMNT_0050614351 /DNA_START=52 /DNA_END=200 /DNA_ORIENTATION=-